MHRITLALALGALVLPDCVWALPQGGTVVTGNGSYTTGSDKMDITGSGNMSVKWDSFNVADNEAVNFKGMNAILNYVTGKQGSEIYGALNGEGVHVFLINPNGVLFGKTAQVNVGALTVSTKTLADVDGTLQNFKNTGAISAFGTAGDAVLINMGKLEADTLHFEGSRIILDTDNVTLSGNGFDGSRAVINGDYANDNVILGYTAYEDGSYAGKDKTFAVNDGAQQVNGYMWVEDAAQLQDINTNLKGNYALKNDIDAGVIANFVPIGNDDVFAGSFDGLGNDIKRLTINRPADDQVGLFYETAENSILRNFSLLDVDIRGHEATGSIVGGNVGTIENVTVTGKVAGEGAATGGVVGLNLGSIINAVTDVIVTGNDSYTGGVVGQNLSGGIIEASDIRGTVNGVKYTGGIAGYNEGEIKNNAIDITVKCDNLYVGGIVGYNAGKVQDSVLTVNIIGNSTYVGGVAGKNLAGGIIEGTDIKGTVKGLKYAGGVVGYNEGKINDSEVDITINNSEGYSGGIAGYNSGTIKGGSLKVSITCNNIGLGGVVGNNGSAGIIDTITVTGNVNAFSNQVVGGIAGNNAGKIINSTNKTLVTAGTNVGGITGQNTATGQVIDCINDGSVNGVTRVGGIVGYNRGIIQGAVNNGNLVVENPDASYIYRGGIVGYNPDDVATKISNVTNTGKVNGYNNIGGIIGYTQSAHDITGITNTGDITGYNNVGGIVGYYSNADDMLLINSNNSGNITGNSMVGGIVGSGGGSVIGGGGLSGCVSIENAENSGNITGTSSVGGIMGGSGYTKLIDKVTNYGTVTGKSQVGGILGNTSSGNIGDALNLGQVSAENSCGGIVGFGSDATVSDSAVYATTDKAGNAYDTSKYNDKGVGKTYAEIFPAPPSPPPEPPILPDDKQNVTQLPEFEENYRSSSASVSAELHTPVMVSPVAENINSGSGSLEVHDAESTFGGFSNTLDAADNVLSGDTEAEQGTAGLSSPSSSDEPGGSRAGSGAGSDNVVNGEDEGDQEEQNNEKI